jgi:ubiquinol-cytochrome c reductase core subunit 2
MLSRLSASRVSSCTRRLAHASVPDVVDTAVGVKTVIIDAEAPVSTVSVLVKAGSRQETSASELGLSQAVRASYSLSNKRAAGWKTVASIELCGASIDVVSSRELLIYTLTSEKQKISHLFPFLYAAAAAPKFPSYELIRTKEALSLERTLFDGDSESVLFDNLHKVAFRRGLGNSLTLSQAQIGSITEKSLLEFQAKLFSPQNVLVVGSGVTADILTEGLIPFSSESVAPSSSPASKFTGGEIRINQPTSSDVKIAIASLSGAENSREAIVDGVLASLLSGVANVNFGSPISPPSQQVSEYHGEEIKGFNFTYSDAGLFGFYIQTRPSESGKALKSLLDSLNQLKGALTEDHALIGKQLYLRSNLASLENPQNLLEHVGYNILLGSQTAHASWKSTLDSISAADLKKGIDKFLNSPKALSVIGNAYDTPYVDEL